jgi:hypothetical protein
MTASGKRYFSLALALLITPLAGCQSMRGHQSVDYRGGQETIQTVKAEQLTDASSSVVTLSRELEESPSDGSLRQTKRSLWSKLQTPTRFLLPRTDTDTNAATVLEAEQGLDDGF